MKLANVARLSCPGPREAVEGRVGVERVVAADDEEARVELAPEGALAAPEGAVGPGRRVAKEAHGVVAENYDQELLVQFQEALTPAFTKALPKRDIQAPEGSEPRPMNN